MGTLEKQDYWYGTNLQCYTCDVNNNENVFYILASLEAVPTKVDEANVDTSSFVESSSR